MIILGIIVALLLFYGISLYNRLVRLNNTVDEAFSTMDVYLKKRWDLIPNLVETVKGYVKHEKDTLAEIVNLRNGAYAGMSYDEKIKTNLQLSSGISKIMALAESYPDLKANENFRDLSNQLSKIEEDIANSRKYYNGSVKILNNTIQVFPNNIISGMFGFKTKTMFLVDESERQNVNVKF